MANPNLLQTTSCVAGFGTYDLSAVTSDITSAVPSDTVRKVVSIYVTNKSTSPALASVFVYTSSTSYYIIYGVTVPAYATIVVTTKDSPIYLLETDYVIKASASTSNALQLTINYEDYS